MGNNSSNSDNESTVWAGHDGTSYIPYTYCEICTHTCRHRWCCNCYDVDNDDYKEGHGKGHDEEFDKIKKLYFSDGKYYPKDIIEAYWNHKKYGTHPKPKEQTVNVQTIGDKWSSSDKGDEIIIEQNGTQIKSNTTSYRSVWLKKIVKKGTHHWTFKIKGYGRNNNWDLVFGLCRSSECQSRRNTYFRGYGMISHSTNVGFRLHASSNGSTDGQWGQKLKVGDKVELYLNFKKNTLNFVINGTNIGNCVKGTIEPNTYRMGIVSGSNQTKVQLISYDNARL